MTEVPSSHNNEGPHQLPMTLINQRPKDNAVGLTSAEGSINTVGQRPYTGRHMSPPDRSRVKWFEV
jgi:hypothetical protein